MSKVIKQLIISISFIVLSMGVVQADQSNDSIQDTQKAAQYFEDEMNFKTSPHGTKYVVEGKVKNVTIVDVRDAKSYAAGHIPGAINLPLEKYNNFDVAMSEYPGLRKDGFNYVYCYELLCTLAQKAAKQFATAGYPVKEMVGGYDSWKEQKLPIEK